MDNPNVYALTMESDAFGAMKSDFNQILRRALTNMEKKQSDEAELTLKLKISLEEIGSDEDLIVKPTFAHKISSVMKIKDEKSGVLSGNYALIWDEESGDYIIRPIDDGQVSMFDTQESSDEEETGPLLLDGEVGEPVGLPAMEVDAVVIEATIVNTEESEYEYDEPEEVEREDEQDYE